MNLLLCKDIAFLEINFNKSHLKQGEASAGVFDASEKLWKDKETAWQAENGSLKGVIKDLKEEVQDLQDEITTLIHDQTKVKSQECKEQTGQSAFKTEDCKKTFDNLGMEESPFIEKIQNLEKQDAHQFQFGGHKLAVLTHDSFNDLVTELNEMKRIVAEQQDKSESINALKKLIEEKETERQMYDKIVVDKKYQDRIQFLDRKKNESERQLVQFRKLNDEQQSEIAIKSKQIEKLKKETSSLKTKNKNITNEFEEKLRKIFNNLMENQIGETTSLK